MAASGSGSAIVCLEALLVGGLSLEWMGLGSRGVTSAILRGLEYIFYI
jgi:hypothetical protein